MKKKMIFAAALLVCAALAGAQAGQGGQGGAGGQGGGQGRGGQGRGGFGQRGFGGQFGGGQSEFQLAFRKDVQADLGVTADQKTKLDELQAKQRGNRGGFGGGGRGGNGGGAGGAGGAGGVGGGNGGNGGGAGGAGGAGGVGGGNGGAGGTGGNGGAAGGRGNRGGGGGFGGGNFNSEEFQKRMEEQRAQQHKDLAAILNEGQLKRLGEIRVQLQGNRGLMQADTQKALGLSTDQVAKIKDLQTKQQEANRALGEKMRNGEMQREDLQKAFESNNKILDAELAKVLTADQTSKFKAMSGKPFKADPNETAGRGGNRGGGGGG